MSLPDYMVMEKDWPIWLYVVSDCSDIILHFYADDNTGSPYMLVIVALLAERTNIANKMPIDHLSSLGVYLRDLPSMYLIYSQDSTN